MIRLVSFNIHNRRGESSDSLHHRMQAVAAFLHSLNPDLICLQEVTPAAFAVLKESLQPHHLHFQPRKEHHTSAEGVPILVLNPELQLEDAGSFWFSESPDISSQSWRSAHPRICTWMCLTSPQGKRLLIYNLHLDHRSHLARQRSLELLRKKINDQVSSDDQLLVCGDFNMPGTRKEIRQLAKTPPVLIDATRHHPIGALRPTYLGWGLFKWAKARIDLCLHNPGLTIETYHVRDPEWQGQQLSDHRALDLKIRSV